MATTISMRETQRLINPAQQTDGIERLRGATQPTPNSFELIEFPQISDTRGNLTVIENNTHIPFEIKRVFYLYDVPRGADRGGHAHKHLHQLLIAIAGSFDVVIDDGQVQTRYHLNRSHYGLHLAPMTWSDLVDFSSGAVCMVLASDVYHEDDYYRNYDDFLAVKRGQK